MQNKLSLKGVAVWPLLFSVSTSQEKKVRKNLIKGYQVMFVEINSVWTDRLIERVTAYKQRGE